MKQKYITVILLVAIILLVSWKKEKQWNVFPEEIEHYRDQPKRLMESNDLPKEVKETKDDLPKKVMESKDIPKEVIESKDQRPKEVTESKDGLPKEVIESKDIPKEVMESKDLPKEQLPSTDHLEENLRSKTLPNDIEKLTNITGKRSIIISKLNRDKVAYDNKMLVHTLQMHYLQPPSLLPYNLTNPNSKNPSQGQTQFIDDYLKQMRNGFFVEVGAFDGEHTSNTLFLERYRNWTGILIEPFPSTYKSLVEKHRKAYALNACLSTKPYPSVATFRTRGKLVKVKMVDKDNISHEDEFLVQCFPLYTILLVIGRLEVDYFSLDVEGAERGVLDTVPWDKVKIKLFSIEHDKWTGGIQNLTLYMERKGYTLVTEIVDGPADLIFVRKNTDI